MATQFSRVRLAANRNQNEQRSRDLRAWMLRVIATFKRRPSQVWDEIARVDRPTRRFDLIQEPMREAVRAGADPDRVVDFYAALLADALAAAPQRVSFDLTTACVRAIKEQSEAISAQAVAHATKCPSDLDRAQHETREAITHNEFYLSALRRSQMA